MLTHCTNQKEKKGEGRSNGGSIPMGSHHNTATIREKGQLARNVGGDHCDQWFEWVFMKFLICLGGGMHCGQGVVGI